MKLPFFNALLSERWAQPRGEGDEDGLKHVRFELPPLSTHQDFAALINALYSGSPLPVAADLNRAVGTTALAKMLQADELAGQALHNLRQMTVGNREKLDEAANLLNEYGTLEEVCRALEEVSATFDDATFASVIRGCRSPAQSNLLAAAISSRASFGHQERDIITIFDYMSTPLKSVSRLSLALGGSYTSVALFLQSSNLQFMQIN